MGRPEVEAARTRDRFAPDEIPVPVERIARQMGAEVVLEALDKNVSGLLLRQGGAKAIGVNASHPPVRQRFTVAHEIGHLVLHPGRDLILDHVRVNLRDDRSSLGTDREEREANAYAAALLMPQDAVVTEVRAMLDRGGVADGRFVADLAQLFDVSEQAMDFRLVHLGLRRQI